MAAAKNYARDDMAEFGDDDDFYEDFDDGLGGADQDDGDDDIDLNVATSRKRKSIGSKRKSSRFKASQNEIGAVKALSCTSKTAGAAASRLGAPGKYVKKNVDLMNKIDRLCEFTHVLMHCILYKINYYNKKTHFDKFLKYNIIVYVRVFFIYLFIHFYFN